jgi:hypothetical protein
VVAVEAAAHPAVVLRLQQGLVEVTVQEGLDPQTLRAVVEVLR